MDYPDIIENLPDIDLKLTGVRGKLLQAGDKQLVFFDIQPIGAIPPHAHQAQWGIVIDGEVELTIGGVAKTYRQGDSYYIPEGVEHSARIISRLKALDLFDEPNRYQPKKDE
ncbi:MAG: cupin domain-containing protein [Pseudomonadota bacterium]